MEIEHGVETYEGFQAAGLLAMALMEATGIREYIDSMCTYDKARRTLSPGMAAKAMIGPIFGYGCKTPLMNIRKMYPSAPVDLMFGPKVEHESLNDSAFGRALDTLFEAKREEMIWKCASMCAEKYGFSSDVFHMDATNFSLYAMPQKERDGVAVPDHCCHAKDGRNGLVQYSMMSVTDSNGFLRCQKPCTGSTSDVVMDRDMIDFISERIDCEVSTVVADSKLANMGTVDLLTEKKLGFVTKCPSSFNGKIRERILKEAEDKIVPCKDREGAKIYGTEAKVGDRTMRFIAYSLNDSGNGSVEFYRDDGEKRLKAVFGKLTGKEFNCRPDAEQAVEDAKKVCDLVAYEVSAEVIPYQVQPKRSERGRPPKGSAAPEPVTRYTIGASWEFDKDLAERMGKDHGTQVLMTNLPSSDKTEKNPRDGADAEAVMMLYLDEYKVEHTYRLMKSGLGVDSVYLHTPERENAMMFVIGIAAIISGTIDAVLGRMKGRKITMDRIEWDMFPVTVSYNRGKDSMRVRGYEGADKELLGYLKELNISPGLLFGFNGD
jgi:transposase